MADDDTEPPEIGGVITMTGIEAIPEPMVVDRALELLGEASASPVLKFIAP